MLLTFLGRKSEEMLMHGEVGIVYELVAKSLRSLVLKVHILVMAILFCLPISTTCSPRSKKKKYYMFSRTTETHALLLLSNDFYNEFQR
jgi:hypothetical protein